MRELNNKTVGAVTVSDKEAPLRPRGFPAKGINFMKKLLLMFALLVIFAMTACESHPDQTQPDTQTPQESQPQPEPPPDPPLSTAEYFYTNRTSAARLCAEDSVVYYRNVFDDSRLYKYDKTTGEKACLTDEVTRVQFISAAEGKIYFSGTNTLLPDETANVYSISPDGQNLTREITAAKAPIVKDGYIYYHDDVVPFMSGICRKNISTGKTETLVSRDYECSDMTINIVDDVIYFDNSGDIFRYSISKNETANITSGRYGGVIGKLQYRDGYLYYYRNDYKTGTAAAVKRMNTETCEEEEIFKFNGGNFWYDNLLVTDDYIFFTGRQSTRLKEGEPEENFVRGTFRYSLADGETVKIYPSNLGPCCHVVGDCLISIMNEEDKGENDIAVIDFDGNDMSQAFPGLK